MRAMAAAVLCAALALRGATAFAQEADLAILGQAEAMVRSGKAEEAWQVLAPLEMRYAGRPDFDYLLGAAALESGRPDRATFVLERVLAVSPGHMAARLEMARAYFELRDFERAERELRFILSSAPAPDIRSLAEAYLAAMRPVAKPERPGLSGYAEVGVGRDTNVSAASAQGSVFVPGLGTEFIPDPRLRRRADNFLALGGGLEYARALRADLGMTANVDLRQRWHPDAEAFDARAADFELGLVRRLGERSRAQLSALYNHYELDNSRYREMHALGAQWSLSLSAQSRLTVSGQGHRIRYRSPDTAASSSDLASASIGMTRILDASTLTVVSGALHLGHDNAVSGRADGDRRLRGFSLGVQRRLRPALEGQLRFSLLGSDYDLENPDFGATRRDRQRDAALGLAWNFAGGWQLRPQIVRTVNRSNLPLSEYRRTESSLTLRYVWN
jgi:hypothetical protein